MRKSTIRIRSGTLKVVTYTILSFVGLTMVVPFLWMLSTSLKSRGAVFLYPPEWIPNPIMWINYVNVCKAIPIGRFVANTAFVAILVTVAQLITCSLGAYAFARLEFPGRDRMFLAYLATMMIPGQVTMIPRFIIMRVLGWIDTYYGLIIPPMFSAFGTFLLRQFFLTVPRELEDAAYIDGCSTFRVYFSIVLPVSKPALATLGIFTFMGQWNAFLWPLIITNSRKKMMLAVGLRLLQGQFGMGNTEWNLLMAGTVLSLLPILVVYIAGQKYFVEGITLSGMGGR